MALTDKLTAIADAIRSKTGKPDGLTLDAMPGEIEGIQTGGGTSMEDGLVSRTITHYANDRVTMVGDGTFKSYGKLVSISLPNVTTIGTEAFAGCGVTHASLPKLTRISNGAFRDSALKTFYFPNVTAIDGYGFRNIKAEIITAEYLPMWDGTLLNNWAFATNSYLKYFQHTFTNGLGRSAFENNRSLEKVDLCTQGLYGGCFSGCTALVTLILRRDDAICELGGMDVLNNTPIIKGTGFVYTPRALIEEYRQATNWSSLLPEQFRAIEDYPEICEVGV